MPRSIRYDDSHLRKLLGLGKSRPSAYGGAGLVGYAQIEQNAHYASGVVAGALLGWSVAHAVVHRCNRPLDSNKLSVSAPSLVFQVVLMSAIRGTTAGRLVNGGNRPRTSEATKGALRWETNVFVVLSELKRGARRRIVTRK